MTAWVEMRSKIDALTAENARLREALRGMSITTILSVGDGHCLLCDGSWKPGEPEAHGPGCLAAPSQGEER